jgi:hypothetical protein
VSRPPDSDRHIVAAQILVVVAGIAALTLADSLGASLTAAFFGLAAFVIVWQIVRWRRERG